MAEEGLSLCWEVARGKGSSATLAASGHGAFKPLAGYCWLSSARCFRARSRGFFSCREGLPALSSSRCAGFLLCLLSITPAGYLEEPCDLSHSFSHHQIGQGLLLPPEKGRLGRGALAAALPCRCVPGSFRQAAETSAQNDRENTSIRVHW